MVFLEFPYAGDFFCSWNAENENESKLHSLAATWKSICETPPRITSHTKLSLQNYLWPPIRMHCSLQAIMSMSCSDSYFFRTQPKLGGQSPKGTQFSRQIATVSRLLTFVSFLKHTIDDFMTISLCKRQM